MTGGRRWVRLGVAAVGIGLIIAAGVGPASMASAAAWHGRQTGGWGGPMRYATIRNFAQPDVLAGNDGLTPSPAAPLNYGAPVLHVDDQGNGIEEHEAQITYFHGTYYEYAIEQACGRIAYFSGAIPGVPRPTPYPPGDYSGGQCGVATYSSTDLTSWHLDNVWNPSPTGTASTASASPMKDPEVVWNADLHEYVMFMMTNNSSFSSTGGLYYSISASPTGPWTALAQVSGSHLAHDYDLAVGPDGTAYVVTSSFSGAFASGTGAPLWDIWVQQLNPEMTATTGSGAEVMQDADFEGVSFFEHEGYWYIEGGPTVSNGPVPIGYFMAPNPLGPWTDAAGHAAATTAQGTLLAENGCGGQNKQASVLPSPEGPVVLASSWGYRTSATDYVVPTDYNASGAVAHADNSQAISSTYWFPLQFNAAHHIRPYTCPATVHVPLMFTARRPVVPPAQYQPDCRVRANSTVEQRGVLITPGMESLKIPVFQRTDNLGPYSQNGPVINQPLDVEVDLPNGGKVTRVFPPTGVSWAPQVINVPLDGSRLNRGLATVGLSTGATNGCYGVLVTPKLGHNPRSSYFAIQDGTISQARDAELYITNALHGRHAAQTRGRSG